MSAPLLNNDKLLSQLSDFASNLPLHITTCTIRQMHFGNNIITDPTKPYLNLAHQQLAPDSKEEEPKNCQLRLENYDPTLPSYTNHRLMLAISSAVIAAIYIGMRFGRYLIDTPIFIFFVKIAVGIFTAFALIPNILKTVIKDINNVYLQQGKQWRSGFRLTSTSFGFIIGFALGWFIPGGGPLTAIAVGLLCSWISLKISKKINQYRARQQYPLTLIASKPNNKSIPEPEVDEEKPLIASSNTIVENSVTILQQDFDQTCAKYQITDKGIINTLKTKMQKGGSNYSKYRLHSGDPLFQAIHSTSDSTYSAIDVNKAITTLWQLELLARYEKILSKKQHSRCRRLVNYCHLLGVSYKKSEKQCQIIRAIRFFKQHKIRDANAALQLAKNDSLNITDNGLLNSITPS